MHWFDPGVSPQRHLLAASVAFLSYLGSDIAAGLFEFWPGTATLYLPAGVAVALLVGLGPGHTISLFLTMLVAAFWPDPSPFGLPLILAWAGLVSSLYGFSAWFLRERTTFSANFSRLSDAALFAGVFVPASLFVATFVNLARDAGDGVAELATVIAAFWIGDASAILAVGPCLLVWAIPMLRSNRRPPSLALEAGPAEVGGQLAAVAIALFALAFGIITVGDPILFVLFAPMFWIAARSGVAAVVIANALLTMGAAMGLATSPISDEPALIVSSVLIILSGSTLLLSSALEERARSRVQLRQRERHLARAEEVAGVGSWVWDGPRSEYAWSDALYRIHGLSPGFPVEPWSFLEFVAPEDRERVETECRSAVAEVRPFGVEYTLVRADDHTRRVVITGDVEGDGAGRVLRVIGTCHDVTEERLAEQEQWHSRRMQMLGGLATSLAHDLNNYFTVIGSATAMLREHTFAGADDVNRIDEVVSSVRTLNDRLLAFARGDGRGRRRINLNRLVESSDWLFERLLGREHALKFELQPDLPEIVADPTEIEQILSNLIINARHAMSIGGHVTVVTRTAHFDDRCWLALEVEDNGEGISESVRGRIFDPFFTTRRSRGGNGVGLATVKRLMDELGGRIEVRSEVGQGSTFVLLFPIAE